MIYDSDMSGDPYDGDYYRVELVGGRSYTFSASANVSSSDTLDTVRIRLRSSSGAELSPDRTDAGATPSFAFTPPSSGLFFLAISASGTLPENKTGDYTITLVDNGASGTADAVREGTDSGEPLGVGSTVTGFINAEPISGDGVTSDLAGGFVDKDWYRVR